MRTTFQSSSSYQSSGQSQGSAQRTGFAGNLGADLKAESDLFLRYANTGDAIIVSGTSDYGILAALKDAILKLRTDYFSRTGAVSIKAEEKDDLDKRFLLFEH